MSYAVYRIIKARYADAPGWDEIVVAIDQLMDDPRVRQGLQGNGGQRPRRRWGNRLAFTILAYGFDDGSNEQFGFENLVYEPVNEPLLPDFPGKPGSDGTRLRWQPLALEMVSRTRAGTSSSGGYPEALSPEWGAGGRPSR